MKRHRLFVAIATAALLSFGGSVVGAQDEIAVAVEDDGQVPETVIPKVDYPTLPQRATSVEGFDVPGWKIERAVWGQFDHEGYEDLALVLRAEDAANVLNNTGGFGESPFDTNPRILAVAMGDDNGFHLVVQDHALIPRRESPAMDDPFQGLSVTETGGLKVELGLFMSAGGWTAGSYAFTFDYRDGAMRLIGYDETMVQRNSGEMETVSVNFLTGRRSDATGRTDSDETKTVWSRTDVRPLPLSEIGDGMAFAYERLTSPDDQ